MDPRVMVSSIRSRVVPGISVTMARSRLSNHHQRSPGEHPPHPTGQRKETPIVSSLFPIRLTATDHEDSSSKLLPGYPEAIAHVAKRALPLLRLRPQHIPHGLAERGNRHLLMRRSV